MRYFVTADRQVGGEHEVHVNTCPRLPNEDQRIFLGHFDGCEAAVVEATKLYRDSTGCPDCCGEGKLVA